MLQFAQLHPSCPPWGGTDPNYNAGRAVYILDGVRSGPGAERQCQESRTALVRAFYYMPRRCILWNLDVLALVWRVGVSAPESVENAGQALAASFDKKECECCRAAQGRHCGAVQVVAKKSTGATAELEAGELTGARVAPYGRPGAAGTCAA